MSLRIVPLGGLGEIGANCMVLESAGRRILIDCGLLFPRLDSERSRGFDAFVPDLGYLRTSGWGLEGVFITHGHEDHLGALPLLLREHPVPVYAPRFALALLDHRTREMGLDVDAHLMRPSERIALGPFEVEPIHVDHSIPDAVGLAVRGEFGCVVLTGDFKIDPTPPGRPTDLEAFAAAGAEGVSCLLADSTNAERPGTTPSEREVGRTLEALAEQWPGRVVVTFFASHLTRLQQLVEVCARLGRKLVVHGRGLQDNLRLGVDQGLLRGTAQVVVPSEQLDKLPPGQVMIAVTGAQGEPRAALSRMAFDPQSSPRIRPGDLVVFSARAIPGNEVGIHHVINRIWEMGGTVITEDTHTDGPVHVSGHASQAELLQVAQAVHPETIIPVHGEPRHLARHSRLIRESDLEATGLLARNGDVIELDRGQHARVVGQVPTGRLAMESRQGGIVPRQSLLDRGRAAEGGAVSVVLLREKLSGALLRSPELTGAGLGADAPGLLLRAREAVRDELANAGDLSRIKEEDLKDAVIRGVERSFRRDGSRRPLVVPTLVEL